MDNLKPRCVFTGLSTSAFTARPSGTVADGMVFEKEVLYEGTFIHPATGKTHVFTKAELEAMAKQTNLLLSRGVSVPFPDGHKFDVVNNLGFWSKFEVRDSTSAPGTAGLFGQVHVALDKVVERMGKTITEVSIYAEREVKLVDGSVIAGPVITHVAATNYPVIPSQNNFTAIFDRGGSPVEFAVYCSSSGQKEPVPMDKFIETVLAAFGLKKDTPVEQLEAKFAEVQTKISEHAALSAKCDKLLTDITALGNGKANDTGPAKSDREKALEAELAKVHGERRKAILDSALETGRVSKAEYDAFSSLISIGKVTALPLGRAAAEVVDAEQVIMSIINSRKPNSAASLAATSRGVSAGAVADDAQAALAQRKQTAAWFAKNGYEVTWNKEGTDYTTKLKS